MIDTYEEYESGQVPECQMCEGYTRDCIVCSVKQDYKLAKNDNGETVYRKVRKM